LKIVEPIQESIELAGEILRSGGLVVLPTETVYGLAADASNLAAVAKIFEAKGRPVENPLIVHVSNSGDAKPFVTDWTERAETLANVFWPGPLTLILPKSELVPKIVTAGLETVAVRMPDHPVALSVIAAAGIALAMPSANRFTGLSPTRVEHLDPEILGSVDLVIDGGPCRIGVESTVVDLTSDYVRVLRPGEISAEQISKILSVEVQEGSNDGAIRSPGMYRKHYSPKSPLRLVSRLSPSDCGLTFGEPHNRQIKMPPDPKEYAAKLYDALFQLDQLQMSEIIVEMPPNKFEWAAVRDRLEKASSK
jgi:L-threonylcarbamoyladenylate synthase